MKIEFELDDNSIIHDVMDGIFVSLLKRQLKYNREFFRSSGYIHPDDKKLYRRNIGACKVLLDYYTGEDDE